MEIGSGDGEGSNDPVTDLLVPGCVTERQVGCQLSQR